MKYLHLFVGVVLVALVGYGAYVLYPRFALDQQGLTLPLLAVGAGLASFFSPCSFPLLVALLGRKSGVRDQSVSSTTVRRAGGFALALALGAALFFMLAGAALALGGAALFESVTFTSPAGRMIRFATGVTLIILGFMQLEKLPNVLAFLLRASTPLMRYQAQQRDHNPILSFFVLGFAYPIAGFG